jgi:hypothetical protein
MGHYDDFYEFKELREQIRYREDQEKRIQDACKNIKLCLEDPEYLENMEFIEFLVKNHVTILDMVRLGRAATRFL